MAIGPFTLPHLTLKPQNLHLFSSDIWTLASSLQIWFFFHTLSLSLFWASDLWLKVSSLRYSSWPLLGSKTFSDSEVRSASILIKVTSSMDFTSIETFDWLILLTKSPLHFSVYQRDLYLHTYWVLTQTKQAAPPQLWQSTLMQT